MVAAGETGGQRVLSAADRPEQNGVVSGIAAPPPTLDTHTGSHILNQACMMLYPSTRRGAFRAELVLSTADVRPITRRGVTDKGSVTRSDADSESDLGTPQRGGRRNSRSARRMVWSMSSPRVHEEA